MKFSCEKEKIKEGLLLLEKIAGKVFSSINLTPIFLEVEPQKVVLTANNLEVGLEYEIPAKTEKTGSLAIPSQLLSQLISNLNPQEKNIKFEQIKQSINIASDQTNATLKTLAIDDYPRIKKIKETDPQTESLKLEATDLVSGVRAVSYAASLSDIKPEIASIYISLDNQELTFVATDSFRLAEKRIRMKSQTKNTTALIPVRNSQEILRIFEKTQGLIELIISKNQLAIKSDNTYFTSRLTEGTFPDYKQIIPRSFSTEAAVSREALLTGLKVSNVFTNRFSQVGLKVLPSENLFEISTTNQEVGEVVTRLAGQLSGEDIESQFNSRFLLDCLQSIKDQEVTLSFAGENKPLLLRPAGNNSFLYLAMPLYRT